MKILLVVLIGVIAPLCGFAQQYITEAKTGASRFRRLTINIRNNIAYVTRQVAPLNSKTTTYLSNFANVSIVNGKFTVPTDGNSYWIIPFEGGTAHKLNSGIWCIDCFCEGQEGQFAECNLRYKTCGGSCSACTMEIRVCDSLESHQGRMAIIKASQVVFE
jgi:hypothetical protein